MNLIQKRLQLDLQRKLILIEAFSKERKWVSTGFSFIVQVLEDTKFYLNRMFSKPQVFSVLCLLC